MLEDNFIVNDCLGLTQFLTQHLDERQAIRYLCSITQLTLEQWKDSKQDLPGVDLTNRHTIEANVKDSLRVFYNDNVTTNFLVRNLGLCPGFQEFAIVSACYTQATFIGASHVASRLAGQPTAPPHAPLASDNTSNITLEAPQQTTPSYSTILTSSGNVNNRSSSTTRGRGKQNVSPRQNSSVTGTGVAADSNKQHPLKFICLSVRSGSDETADTLQTELELKWKGHKGLKIEPVSKTMHSTTFRVQMTLTSAMYTMLDNSNLWPERMTVSRWKGNPRSPLQPLETREQMKKIYIGNLSKDVTKEQITSNMKYIYEQEMREGLVKKIETVINQKRQSNQANQNENTRMSVCVILTSHPGKSLESIKIKKNHFPDWIEKTVRFWRGSTPRSQENQKMQHLNWQ